MGQGQQVPSVNMKLQRTPTANRRGGRAWQSHHRKERLGAGAHMEEPGAAECRQTWAQGNSCNDPWSCTGCRLSRKGRRNGAAAQASTAALTGRKARSKLTRPEMLL